ncbi:uncharacterized protein LOC111714307 [Eurytemora carolleeae]|uniref:uncharacterized protein LOC111714307 n=1 Tax=Eurytemora carolleeae TaxID=1294199 RepID=UPI000C774196|nr:uncharacterized protein LOC111714307 [Eurytemora carolleeae]|eukprot:XP_023345158.1 uncharacterized protein LOC111714307 [Eurytemora affinis]
MFLLLLLFSSALGVQDTPQVLQAKYEHALAHVEANQRLISANAAGNSSEDDDGSQNEDDLEQKLIPFIPPLPPLPYSSVPFIPPLPPLPYAFPFPFFSPLPPLPPIPYSSRSKVPLPYFQHFHPLLRSFQSYWFNPYSQVNMFQSLNSKLSNGIHRAPK